MYGRRAEQLDPFSFGGWRQQMGVIDASGKTVRTNGNRSHQIQTQQGKVGQVILGQGLTTKMSMDATQPAQAAATQAVARQIGDNDFTIVADDDMHDRALAVDQNCKLATNLAR